MNMYARIENGAVVEYPLNQHTIRLRFKNTSFAQPFGKKLPEGYVKVLPGIKPIEDEFTFVDEGTPVLVGNDWVQTFIVKDKYTPEEMAQINQEKINQKWEFFRQQRNGYLVESDFIIYRHKEQKELGLETSISDGKYQEWLVYRQQLRDLPKIVTDINNVQWPQIPV